MFIYLPAVLAGAGSGLVAARNTAFRVAWERGTGRGFGVVERREGSERTEPGSDGGAAQIFKPAERFFTAWRSTRLSRKLPFTCLPAPPHAEEFASKSGLSLGKNRPLERAGGHF